MRSRPNVEIKLSKVVFPGDNLEVELTLDFRGQTPVDCIRLILVGMEKFSANPEKTSPQPFQNILRLEAQLSGKAEIPPGKRFYRATFPIPQGVPSTYLGKQLCIVYELTVEVEIPWWPDLCATYSISVAPRPAMRLPPSPINQTSARGGDEIFFEVTLDDRIFAPGDVLSGALALGNVRGRKIRGLVMALVGYERTTSNTVLGSYDFTREATRLLFHYHSEAVQEGREVPFRLHLPVKLWPSFQTQTSMLTWSLGLRANVAWGSDAVHRVPLLVRVLDRPSDQAVQRIHVGPERWRAVWAHAGAPIGLAIDPSDLGLAGTLSGLAASVFTDPESARPAIAAELRYPSWGLGLRVRLRRIGIFAAGDEDGFGRRYRVDGRDPGQTRAVLTRRLRAALLAFDEAYLDDDHVRVRMNTGSFDQPHIGKVLALAAALAVATQEALAATPPPPPMAAMVPAWRAFADELRGELAVGCMAIRGGVFEGARLDVETIFDSQSPERTRVTLALDPPLPGPFDPTSEEDLAKAQPGVRDVVAQIVAASRSLRVQPHELDVELAAPIEDPAALRDTLTAMLALGRKLRGASVAGPYR
jgi:hypothetical protein